MTVTVTLPSLSDQINAFSVQNISQLVEWEYADNCGLSEELVKAVVSMYLNRRGFSVRVGAKGEKGPDIEAATLDETIVLEAKGEASRPEMFGNFFLAALGQILLRMTRTERRYVIALPYHKKFVKMVQHLPGSVRQKLQLEFWLVGKFADNCWAIALLLPSTQ